MTEPILLRSAAIFAAMGNPMRLRITELLTLREMTVSEIWDELGLPQSTTSQHLAVLLRTGALSVRAEGATRYYRARGPRIGRLIHLVDEFCQVQSLHGEPEAEAVDLGN